MNRPSEEALALHHDSIVIDLHADTLELVRLGYDLQKEHRSMVFTGHVLGHVDIPRLRRGGVTAQLFGVVIPPWSGARNTRRKIRQQGALLEELCEKHPADLIVAHDAETIEKAKSSGRIACLLGAEGSHGLVDNLDALDALRASHVRYVGPAHLFDSPAGQSSYFHRSGTLAPAGRGFVEALQERSLIVDLAHLARAPFLEVCRDSTRPLLVSHTGCSSIKPLWRNIDDEQIKAVAETGGVIGIIFTPRYLGLPGVAGVVTHLEHLIDLGGADVAALGSDFDGLVRPPRDLGDTSGIPLITDELLRRGHGEGTIRKILGQNVLRLLESVP